MVDKQKCTACCTCINACPVGAIKLGKDGKAEIDKNICIQCGTCQAICPTQAIDLSKN